MLIRAAIDDDWPQLWPFIRTILRAGDTYTLATDMSEADARGFWMRDAPWQVFVAEEGGEVLGSGKIGPNQGGPGAHIANGSYMVADAARGRGVGRALVTSSLQLARDAGYEAMQFNAVAESNHSAVRLYEELGFDVIGTVRRGFDHPQQGRIGLHIMYCAL